MMRCLRGVCILTESYAPIVGGGETQARALAESLAGQGLDVHVLTRRTYLSLCPLERHGGVDIHRLPPIGREHLKKWGLALTTIPVLIRLRHQYDLIFVSGFRVLGIPAVIVSKLLGKACILKADNNGEMSGAYFHAGMANVGIRQDAPFFRLGLRLRNAILRRANGFVAISSDIAHELSAQQISPSRITAIPNSVDVALFHPVSQEEKLALRVKLGLPPAKILFTFTGRLVSYKGLPLLLRVWKALAAGHANIMLVLVGAGSLDIHNCEEQLRTYVQENDLHDSVLFAGEVDNVHEYLQASDIFVFPTQKEAFGIALIEAMASGLPTVSTPVGGLKDIVRHGENGILVEPENFESLYCALEALIPDESLRSLLGKHARQTVLENYSVEQVAGRYMELFQHSYQVSLR